MKNLSSDKKARLQDAFIFTLPLMMVDATSTKFTNTVEATAEQAPINQMFHAAELVDAAFTDIVTPNTDTIYSQAFLDLSADAVIFEFPKTDRFCTVQILDAYTNTVVILNLVRLSGDKTKFILTGPNFNGAIPAGMTPVACPTNLVWVLIRTICNDKDDVANVAAIQKKMDSYTLAQYESHTTSHRPKGVYREEHNFIPVQYVFSMSLETYFERANQLMLQNPPAPADRQMLERLAEIHVGPGLTFDKERLGKDADVLWTEILQNAAAYCVGNSLQYMVKNGSWSYFGKPIAEFGTAYVYRALIALAGLGANPVSVAIYPKGEYDSAGERLNGSNKYVLHFEAGQLPPVQTYGFWSVTAYNSSNDLLIDNEIDRYCINDRSPVICNADGSLDIYCQTERPREDRVANWLPVAKGDFHFILRVYLPEAAAIHAQWPAPTITKCAEV